LNLGRMHIRSDVVHKLRGRARFGCWFIVVVMRVDSNAICSNRPSQNEFRERVRCQCGIRSAVVASSLWLEQIIAQRRHYTSRLRVRPVRLHPISARQVRRRYRL
jgi:hypothetical protein